MTQKKTIAVGLSGGIDSAVTAALLCREGHDVRAVTMQFWNGSVNLSPNRHSACFGPGETEDIETARIVADFLGIPHSVIPLAEEYEKTVLNYYRSEYLSGRTPNPCVVCNSLIKFGALWGAIENVGIACECLAMGHYARVEYDGEKNMFKLRQGTDASKDQSYFLHRLTQRQLARIRLPLGAKFKKDVIALAKEWKIPRVTERKESQDFLESDDHACLFDKSSFTPGPILDIGGRVIGEHRGLVYYTVGQREGLGVSSGRRMYVKEIRAADNAIVVGERDDILVRQTLIKNINWIPGYPPAKNFVCQVRLRYRHAGVRAKVELIDDKQANVIFGEPQFAVTPGQAAVFYHGDEMLGGGWIS